MGQNLARFGAFFGLPLVLASMSAHAAPPSITKVTFKASGSLFTATITGKQFGTAPAGVPCTSCAIPEFSLVESSSLATSLTYNITAWTNTKVTLTGINGTAADAVFVTLKNDSLKNIATWGGNFPGKSKNPSISGVAFSGKGASLHITITGKGFGSAPPGVPGVTDIPYLNYLDWNAKKPAQDNYPWAAGWAAQGFTDTVTLNYVSWSDTKIVAGGFGGAYGTDGFTATKGDPYLILLWQPPGINPGSTGPQTAVGGRLP